MTMAEGKGKTVYANGEVYEGMYSNGMRHGYGTYKWSNGNAYAGEWVCGEMSGKGVYTWENGDVFTGEWAHGMAHGVGTKKYKNGDTYHGELKNDHREGYGVYKWGEGGSRAYEGYWKAGSRHGEGTMCAEGVVMKGNWTKSQKDGIFIETSFDGKTHEVTWEKDHMLSIKEIPYVSPETLKTVKKNPGELEQLQAEVERLREILEKKVEVKASDESCVVCTAVRPNCVIDPCGHMCVCLDCSEQVKACPICRGIIRKTIRVFRV